MSSCSVIFKGILLSYVGWYNRMQMRKSKTGQIVKGISIAFSNFLENGTETRRFLPFQALTLTSNNKIRCFAIICDKSLEINVIMSTINRDPMCFLLLSFSIIQTWNSKRRKLLH